MFEEFYQKYETEEQEVIALIRKCIGAGYTTRKSSAENTKNVSIGQQKAFSFRISCIARSNSFPAANVKELPLQEPLSVTNR